MSNLAYAFLNFNGLASTCFLKNYETKVNEQPALKTTKTKQQLTQFKHS